MDANVNITELDEIEAALNELSVESIVVADAVEHELADDDPINRTTLDEILAGYALLKGDNSSRTFVGSKTIHRNSDVTREERAARERVKDKRRKRIARAQDRRVRIEKNREAKPIDSVRMAACLTLLGNLIHVVSNLTLARYNRFRRVLGDVHTEDIASDAVIRIAEVLSKTDAELVELAQATLWLKDAPQPYVAANGPKGTGRLLGTIISVIGNVIQEAYRTNTTSVLVKTINEQGETVYERKDTTLESFEYLETVAWNTRTDIDEMLSHSKASGKPSHEYSIPGMRELIPNCSTSSKAPWSASGWTMCCRAARRQSRNP
jgi:hypothetical protein